jgi:hypothetical protein
MTFACCKLSTIWCGCCFCLNSICRYWLHTHPTNVLAIHYHHTNLTY